MTTLLPAAGRLECRPGHDARSKVRACHEASASSVRSQSPFSAPYDAATVPLDAPMADFSRWTPSSVLGISEIREPRTVCEPVTCRLLLGSAAELIVDPEGHGRTRQIPASERARFSERAIRATIRGARATNLM